jgi:hypothetical protein
MSKQTAVQIKAQLDQLAAEFGGVVIGSDCRRGMAWIRLSPTYVAQFPFWKGIEAAHLDQQFRTHVPTRNCRNLCRVEGSQFFIAGL